MHQRQAQTRAFADLLGGEERIEDPLEPLGGNAGAGILDDEPRIGSGGQRAARQRTALGQSNAFQQHGEYAAAVHGV